MEKYQNTFSEAAELIASNKESFCCHAICKVQGVKYRERKEENILLAEYFKPKEIQYQSDVWWNDDNGGELDQNARIFALLLMAEICA